MNSSILLRAIVILIALCAGCVPQQGPSANGWDQGAGATARQHSGLLSLEAPADWRLEYDAATGLGTLVNAAVPNSTIMVFVMQSDPNVSAEQLLRIAAASVGEGISVAVRGGQGNVATLRGTLDSGGKTVAVAMEAHVRAQQSFVGVYAGEASVLNQLGGPTLLGRIVASAVYGVSAGGVANELPATRGAADNPVNNAVIPPTVQPRAGGDGARTPPPSRSKGKDFTGTWIPGAVFDEADPKPGVVIEVHAVAGPRDARNPGPLIVGIKKHWFTLLPDSSAGYKHMLGSLGLSPDGNHVCVKVMTIDQIDRQVGCVPVSAVQRGLRPFVRANGFQLIFARWVETITSAKQEQYCYFENQPAISAPAACRGSCAFDPIREIIDYNCNLGAASPGELNFDR